MPRTDGKQAAGTKYDFNRDQHNLQTTFGIAFNSIVEGTSVLDIGCATGNIMEALKKDQNCTVEGVEIEGKAVEIARKKGLEVHHLDLESSFLDWDPKTKYDYILLLDVIEHLHPFPTATLEKIRSLLTDTGTLILSTPNVGHIDAVTRIVNGNLVYTERGIFDKTHLHFYTPYELLEYTLELEFLCNSIKQIKVPRGKTELAQEYPIFDHTSKAVNSIYPVNNQEVYQHVYFLRKGKLSPKTPFNQYLASLDVFTPKSSRKIEPDLWNIIVRYHTDRIDQLADALYSVAGQSYQHIKVILVGHTADKALYDKINKLVERFNALLTIEHTTADPRKKRGHPLNVGLERSDGTYVSFLDYDDRYYPHFGELLIKALQRDTSNFSLAQPIKVNQISVNNHYKTISKEKTAQQTFNPVLLTTDNYLPINSFVFDRTVFPEIRFDESIDVLEDWDFLLQMLFSENLKVTCLRIPISEYYIRDDNTNSPVYQSDDSGKLPPESLHARKHIPSKYLNKTFPVLYQKSFEIYPDYNDILHYPLEESDIGKLETEKESLRKEIEQLKNDLTTIQSRKGYKIYNKILSLIGRNIPTQEHPQ